VSWPVILVVLVLCLCQFIEALCFVKALLWCAKSFVLGAYVLCS
jgi:hypothetical protein